MINQAATAATNPASIKFFGICLSKCPSAGDWVCTAKGDADIVSHGGVSALKACKNSVNGGQFLSKQTYPSAFNHCSALMQECFEVPHDTTDILFRCIYSYRTTTNQTQAPICLDPLGIDPKDTRCVKTTETAATTKILPSQPDLIADSMATVAAIWSQYMADIANSWVVIVGVGAGGAVALGFIWLIILRFFAGCFVGLAICLLQLALVVLALYAYARAGVLNVWCFSAQTGFNYDGTHFDATGDQQEKDAWMALAIIGSAAALISFVVIIFMRKSIKLAVALIKETTKAVAHMPLIMGFPVTTVVSIVVMFLWWAWTFGNCFTMGEITTDDLASTATETTQSVGNLEVNYTSSIESYENTPARDYVLAFLVFALFWMNAFIQGVAATVICGAFASWYWSERDPDSGHRIYKDRFPVFASFWRALRYHLGSVAFGSLIVAICQFLRVCLEYLDKKTQGLQDKNCMLKFIFKVTRCCLWCFEKCIRYITRKAYIVIAIKGSNFCSATVTVFHLLASHGGTMGFVNLLCAVLMIIGKFLIVAGCVVLGFLLFRYDQSYTTGDKALSSTLLPLILTGLLAWFVASAFLMVYDMGVDTLLVSYLFDLKENQPGKYMFSESLAKAVGRSGQTQSANAQQTQSVNKEPAEVSNKYVVNEPESDNGDNGVLI